MKPCPYCDWNDDHPYHYPDCPQLEIARLRAIDRKNCKEVPPGNGVCDMCVAGEPELCRYVNTNGAMKEIDRLRAIVARVEDVEGMANIIYRCGYPSIKTKGRAKTMAVGISEWVKGGL